MHTGLLSTTYSQILLILLIIPFVAPHPCHHLGLDARPCLSLAPVCLLTSNLEQFLSLCFVFHNCVRLGSPSSNAERGIQIQVDIWGMILGLWIGKCYKDEKEATVRVCHHASNQCEQRRLKFQCRALGGSVERASKLFHPRQERICPTSSDSTLVKVVSISFLHIKGSLLLFQ